MARSPIANIRQRLLQSHQDTLQLIRQINENTATYRPRPNAWNIKDHVIHLVATEESIIHFARRILNENHPISPLCHDEAFNRDTWNNQEVAERSGYTWTEAIDALDQTRTELLALLDLIPEEALSRIGSHPVWGDPVTLTSILRSPYRHERGHREEIVALRNLQQSWTG